MAQETDDLEKLLVDVRKTISENRQFLEKLLDETEDERDEVEPESEVEGDATVTEEDFEEL